MFAGCAVTDGSEGEEEVGITEQEIAAGEAWLGGDGSEPDEHTDGEQSLSSDWEPSASFLDDEPTEDRSIDERYLDDRLLDDTDVEGIADDIAQPSPEEIEETQHASSCRRVTAYRRGRRSTICVTTIDGKLVEVNTARAFRRMRAAARRRGVYLRVVSGFRTMAQQRYLYNCYRTRRCNGGNLAAPPGYSNHQSGVALDLNSTGRGVYGFLANHGRRYGFRRTVPSERWHWER